MERGMGHDFANIAAKASGLYERLAGGIVPEEHVGVQHQAVQDQIDRRLARWRTVVGKDDERLFQRRLDWSGLNIETIRPLLGPVRLANGQPPPWIETLKAIVHESKAFGEESSGDDPTGSVDRPLAPGSTAPPGPFEELLLPLVRVARRKIERRLGRRYQVLSERASSQFERYLLNGLGGIFAKTLHMEFSIFRLSRQSRFEYRLGQLDNVRDLPRELYQQFNQGLLRDGLLSFYSEFAVLAKLASLKIDDTVDSICELVERLCGDWPDIQRLFLSNDPEPDNCPGTNIGSTSAPPPSAIDEVEPGLSDPHLGRTVIWLSLVSGQELIYKPRDLDLEAAFQALLRQCNESGPALSLKTLTILNRKTHGWVEYVRPLPCNDHEEAKRFHLRAGTLLCLAYVLNGTDFHYENIISHGEHPVLIDLETILTPRMRELRFDQEWDGAYFLAFRVLLASVLKTSLLPQWELSPDQRLAYDVSGLGGSGDESVTGQNEVWRNVNTDYMALTLQPSRVPPQANRLRLNGKIIRPEDFTEDIVSGFTQMYSHLLGRSDDWAKPGGELSHLRQRELRFVFRPTVTYGMILKRASTPEFMRDGMDRFIELDFLSRLLISSTDTALIETGLPGGEAPFYWPILEAELHDLERWDIPRFTALSDGRDLRIAPGKAIPDFFEISGIEESQSCLADLSDSDRDLQVGLIRSSLGARGTRGNLTYVSPSEPSSASSPDEFEATIPTGETLVEYAVELGRELQQHAIRSPDGSSTWIGMRLSPTADRYRLSPLEFGLYDGGAGIAMFLSALAHAAPGDALQHDGGFKNLALEALNPIRDHLRQLEAKGEVQGEVLAGTALGIGGMTGLGSLTYAFVRCAGFLEDPELLADAERSAHLITPALVHKDDQFDVMSGSAGAVLGLLALYEATKMQSVLDKATACGQHLLEQRGQTGTGHEAWATLRGRFLTGFSHGAAGIAYALLKLHLASGQADFLEAAKEGIAYEDAVFSPANGNWPDYRTANSPSGEPTFMTAWCNGATGIGLARLAGLDVLDTPRIRDDIDTAVATTMRHGLDGGDHLCCGNFGRIEFLKSAAEKLRRPELGVSADGMAGNLLARANQGGAFRMFERLAFGMYSPGFFQGAAGIGYQLLRLAHPDRFPSPLLMN